MNVNVCVHKILFGNICNFSTNKRSILKFPLLFSQQNNYYITKVLIIYHNFNLNHLSGCCCMWKAAFAPNYLGPAVEVVNMKFPLVFSYQNNYYIAKVLILHYNFNLNKCYIFNFCSVIYLLLFYLTIYCFHHLTEHYFIIK